MVAAEKKKKTHDGTLGKLQRRWINALQSGVFPQGKGYLLRDGRYCCLGVACEMVLQSLRVGSAKHAQWGGCDKSPPDELIDALGMYRSAGERPTKADGSPRRFPRCLWQMNDKGMSFEEIADLLSSDPANWFVEPR